MELPQAKVDEILYPLVQREMLLHSGKDQPGYWVRKLFAEDAKMINIDRGIFSIYFFNIVCAQPGQAVFQGAGIPHAYLEGQNVELMANSDNVLRGGLTPKHVDVAELLKHTVFEGIIPKVLQGDPISESEKDYPCPVEDFAISAINLGAGGQYQHVSQSPEIYILIEGEIVTSEDVLYKRGEAFYVIPGSAFSITSRTGTLIYKAFLSN